MAERNRSSAPADVNERLAYVIDCSGLKGKDFASRIDRSPAHLSQIKTGKRPLVNDVAHRIEKEFNFRADWLLTGEGPMRIGEEHTKYAPVAGPDSITWVSRPSARAIEALVYKCEACRAEVELGAKICHRCLAELIWPDDTEKGDVP